jgi:hypothetical protein
MQYRAEATSLVGFVQQIACCYLRHGYWWSWARCVRANRVDTFELSVPTLDSVQSTGDSVEQILMAISQYIRYYNFERKHSSIEYLKPAQFEDLINQPK